jgi:carboxyl-terminal processing protease
MGITAAVLCGAWVLTAAAAPDKPTDRVKDLRKQAVQHERRGDWLEACNVYEKLLKFSRSNEIRQRYRNALRHYYQVLRHRDAGYRKDVLDLKWTQALRLYEIVLINLLDASVEKEKIDPALVFRRGLEEFVNALADPVFCQTHLQGLRPDDTRTFRTYLQRNWGSPGVVLTRDQAIEQVRDVAMKAFEALQLGATTTIMEFTCGACCAVDEYTVYLTPGQFRELADLLKGEYVGVGLQLAVENGKLVVVDVVPDVEMADKMVPPPVKGDHVLSIDKKPAADLNVEAAMKLLEGEVGTVVEIVVASPGMPERAATLRRRPLLIPSVFPPQMHSGAIGYLRITAFQETTPQEFDAAVQLLNKAAMKALILDLRGNSGGVFDAAIDVARRFLCSGIITRTQHRDPDLNRVYEARNPAALTMPLVILVDAETASAAEVLAGALKEHKRARLVGQTTYGKGCSQGFLPLPPQGQLKLPREPGGKATGAIRITVARFFSPSGSPYTGRGVVPHILVNRPLIPGSMSEADDEAHWLEMARAEAQRLLDMVR